MRPSVSLIITTYNWPQALDSVLRSITFQNPYPGKLEVLIADDGSAVETKKLIQSWQKNFPVPLKHVWQPDEGFQAAKIRNLAVQQSNYEYMVFIDGDCILSPNFIRRHMRLAESSWFVAGSRVLLSERFSNYILKYKIPLTKYNFKDWFLTWRAGGSNRLLPNFHWPLPTFRKYKKNRWRGAKTCNLGIWRKDFLSVKGFDEGFTGWGYEDSELIVRLLHSGVFHKTGKLSVPVYHLWHPDAPRDKKNLNRKTLQKAIYEGRTQARKSVFLVAEE